MKTIIVKKYFLYICFFLTLFTLFPFLKVAEAGDSRQKYYRDADHDGYGDPNNYVTARRRPSGYVSNKNDCNDSNANIHPGAVEVCDGFDNDCDGQTDEGCATFYRDADGDGYGNVNDSIIDTSTPAGYVSDNTDCNDSNVNINPAATEVCDGADNNCDGQVDEGCTTYYQDADGDGYGNINYSIIDTSAPAGYVSDSTDCDDTNANVNPGATEVCDGADNNCDGQVDEGCATYYQDTDGDTYGNLAVSVVETSQPVGYVSDSSDCNDSDASVNPGAVEIPGDGIDQNCDGVDPAPAITFENVYGNSGSDSGYSVDQTTDGGYITVGYTMEPITYSSDMYLVKVDETGTEQWSRMFDFDGGMDWGFSVKQTSDGGYILLGLSGGGMSGVSGMFLVKTDPNGIEEWRGVYGDSRTWGFSVEQTTDGGYILLGTSMGNIIPLNLVKVDSNGNLSWSRNLGTYDEIAHSVKQTADGGYAIFSYIMMGGALSSDCILTKTDANGNVLWSYSYGSPSDYESADDGQLTADGGFIILGNNSSGIYLVKTDEFGMEEWSNTVVNTNSQFGYSIDQTTDGGFVITGEATSDLFLLKTDSNGNKEWSKTFGGIDFDAGYSVQQTTDGGYVITGETNTHMYLIKTNSMGDVY